MVQLGFNLSSWALIGGNEEMTTEAALQEGKQQVTAAIAIYEEVSSTLDFNSYSCGSH